LRWRQRESIAIDEKNPKVKKEGRQIAKKEADLKPKRRKEDCGVGLRMRGAHQTRDRLNKGREGRRVRRS